MIVFNYFENEIKLFCEQNSLDFNKVKLCPKCGNEQMLFIQHYEEDKAKEGLNDNEPAEILLFVKKNSNGTIDIKKGNKADSFLHI